MSYNSSKVKDNLIIDNLDDDPYPWNPLDIQHSDPIHVRFYNYDLDPFNISMQDFASNFE